MIIHLTKATLEKMEAAYLAASDNAWNDYGCRLSFDEWAAGVIQALRAHLQNKGIL